MEGWNEELLCWSTMEAALAAAARNPEEAHTPWLSKVTSEGWFAPDDAPELEALGWGITDEETGSWVLTETEEGYEWTFVS